MEEKREVFRERQKQLKLLEQLRMGERNLLKDKKGGKIDMKREKRGVQRESEAAEIVRTVQRSKHKGIDEKVIHGHGIT